MSRHSTGLTLTEVIVILLVAVLATMIVLPTLARARTPSRRTMCSSNLSQIGKAMIMYSLDPANKVFPTGSGTADPYNDPNALITLHLLRGKYIQSVRTFRCDGDKTFGQTKCSYSYDPGHDPDNSMVVVASDKKGTGSMSDNHGPSAGQNCLMAGGNVEFRDTAKNEVGFDEDQGQFIDSDIFSLTPSVPRELDSYLRQ